MYKQTVAIGRTQTGRPEVDVNINDVTVSKKHAMIKWVYDLKANRDGFYLKDQGSKNGTRVGTRNGKFLVRNTTKLVRLNKHHEIIAGFATEYAMMLVPNADGIKEAKAHIKKQRDRDRSPTRTKAKRQKEEDIQ